MEVGDVVSHAFRRTVIEDQTDQLVVKAARRAMIRSCIA
jgi:hypothetical protein